VPTSALDPTLLAVLACPDAHHAPLRPDAIGSCLICTACGRMYNIVAGIPVLVLDRDHH
jgi:uncharacterized protein